MTSVGARGNPGDRHATQVGLNGRPPQNIPCWRCRLCLGPLESLEGIRITAAALLPQLVICIV